MSAKTPKNEQSVTTHFKAVFRGDLEASGNNATFNLACDYGLAKGL